MLFKVFFITKCFGKFTSWVRPNIRVPFYQRENSSAIPSFKRFHSPSSDHRVSESDGDFAAGNLPRHLRVGDLWSVCCMHRTSPDTEEGAKEIQGGSSPSGNVAKKTRESGMFCGCSVFLLMLCMTQWPWSEFPAERVLLKRVIDPFSPPSWVRMARVPWVSTQDPS